VEWVSTDITRGPREGLLKALGQPDVVVSCVGAVGFDKQGLLLGNGKANAEIATAAKAAGASRIAFCGVSKDVSGAAGWLPGFFEGYFTGKQQAAEAFTNAVGEDNACLVMPTFIYGGDDFGLFPPRVSAWYGGFVEDALSLPPCKFLADALPGLLKVALRPPVAVEAVAAALSAQALGTASATTLDGTDAINAAAGRDSRVAVKARAEAAAAAAAA